jgi:PKHD-type hydroxylase
MQLKNYYWYFKSAIDPETCQKIIDMGEEKMQKAKNNGETVEAYTYGDKQKSAMGDDAEPQNDKTIFDVTKKNKKTYIRDSNVSWLSEQWLYDLFYPYIHQANESAGWNWNFDVSEPFQFTKYEKNQFYGWHADGEADKPYQRYIHGITSEPLRPNGTLPAGWVRDSKLVGKIRKLSMTVNLCPENTYKGGELKFDFGMHREEKNRFHSCTEIRPQGSIIIFPSFLYHCVAPVTKGTRYSLVLWTLGDKWK